MALTPTNRKELADQALRIFTNTRADMRSTSAQWQSRIDSNGGDRPAGFVAIVIRDFGATVRARLQTVVDMQASVVEALGVYSITEGEMTTEYNLLRTAAELLRDTPADGSTVDADCTTLLSGLPGATLLF